MPIANEILENLAAPLRIAVRGASSNSAVQQISTSIVPALNDMMATDFLSAPMDLDLKFLTKGVVTSDDNLVSPFDSSTINTNTVNGLPIEGLLNSANLVPGDLGQIAGTVNLPFPINVPVGAEVKWSIKNSNGQTLNKDVDYLAPNGETDFEANFIIPPLVAELTNVLIPSFETYQIIATVTLKAGAGGMDHVEELPPATVRIPVIGIPTVLAMFLHKEFSTTGKYGPAALVMLPNNSPFRNFAQLQNALTALGSTVAPLIAFPKFSSLVSGLTFLTNELSAQLPRIAFRTAERISNLNNIDLIKRGFLKNDIEAEDELSSLIFLGVPGSRAQFFTDRSFKGGQFDLTIGKNNAGGINQEQLFTFIEDLHTNTPLSQPLGGEIEIVKSASTFGDKLSSIQFDGTAVSENEE